jgi:S-DNA-T family DNA segregation ATPase FtsK/SpoIIIE
MNATTLIGLVGFQYLRTALGGDENTDGLARFLLDRLTRHQVAEICLHVLADPAMREQVEIKVPRHFGGGLGLPEEILTDDSMVFWRNNTEISKSAILLVNTNDDQGQSLGQVTPIGASELKSVCEYWVNIAARDLGLSQEHRDLWVAALQGLHLTKEVSLEKFAEYVAATHLNMLESGVSIKVALGWALPSLEIPRDSGCFDAIKPNNLGKAESWQKRFREVISKHACYLRKQMPTGRPIEREELRANFENVKDTIPEEKHGIVRAFVESQPGYGSDARALAELEWEKDNINSLFQGLKAKKVDLASATLDYFDSNYTDALTPEETQYLENLRKRKTKEPVEDDRQFYESHRRELEENPSLKAKWDKFIYGQPIECSDFLVGLLEAVERLFDRAGRPLGRKSLIIRTLKKTKKYWRDDLNTDMGLYFCTRYRGLEALTSPAVRWETDWLFEYDQFIEQERNKPKSKFKPNDSIARAATEIKFEVELRYRSAGEVKEEAVQVIWRGKPKAIGTELKADLERLSKYPTSINQVQRILVNRKGRLQGIALDDVTTFDAAFRQDRGSLISPYDSKADAAKVVTTKLTDAVQADRLSESDAEALSNVLEAFSNSYKEAIQAWIGEEGIASSRLLSQAATYQRLMNTLLHEARGDANRNALYSPILKIGCIEVTGGKPAAIIAPWHPLRMAAIAVKAQQFAGLLKYLLGAEEVDFGDPRLFFNDLKNEFAHPYYPEICVGYSGSEPKLLSTSDTVNDYSLMERPVKDAGEQATNENPSEATSILIGLTHRYLELLPHERTNLTLVLYNCDSTRLPQMVVSKLSGMEEEHDEVRCQVTLRHQDKKKLNRLYREMLEGFDADPDAYIASEMSQDYMAKLRIGVMADQAPMPDPKEGKPADIVFLQDVISRQADEAWLTLPREEKRPDILDHVPPRWGRKHPAEKGELKSTAYLVCPVQPDAEADYTEVIYCLVDGENTQSGARHIPARQITFQSQEARKIVEEVHRIGEWVVNYDSLLEKRQLVAQGVNVIRYNQSRADGHNLLVSSDASLNLLKVLVRRRLADLQLQLPESEMQELTERFIREANVVSGDIVLRAAKNGKYASELLGVVLSKALVAEEMGSKSPIGWYFLDDYASWLGQPEEQIADILAISPTAVNGRPVLKIIVSEAKYVTEAGLGEAQRKSQKQLRDTVARIESAIFGNPGRLDRDLWLSRISDLMLEGIELSSSSSVSLDEYRRLIRQGRMEIDLSGYSHVFISGPSDSTRGGEQNLIPKVERCYQEVFSRGQVRDLVLAFHKKQPLSKIREQLGDDRPWERSVPRPPAPRVSWIKGETADAAAPAPPDTSSTLQSEGEMEQVESGLTFRVENAEAGNATTQFTLPDDSGSSDFASGTGNSTDENMNTGLQNWIERNAIDTPQDSKAEAWLNEIVQKLKHALIGYDLQAMILGQRLTPNAALIRLRGSDRLKVGDLEKKRKELLTTHGLSVINVLGMPGEIVVSVARPERQAVSLAKVWAERKINSSSGINLSLVVGLKEVDGEILYLNLGSSFAGLQQHAPHTLIAGATGSGKSVLLRNLLLDICATNPPPLSRIYLIDPKAGVDYFLMEDLPHLSEGIIIEQERAIEVLQNLVIEMDQRYLRFREQRVNNLLAYNTKVVVEKRLPILWVVHDEFAEWMLVENYRDEVSAIVQRLGVKARAAGIHLIFAAQRPDATVLPVQLRDNLGNRLILKVESVGTSEICLGQKGAENLLGKGHVVARLSGETDLIYAQVPFISDEDAETLVKTIRDQHVPDAER